MLAVTVGKTWRAMYAGLCHAFLAIVSIQICF